MLDLVVITRDEADRLADCLRSAPIARAWVLDAGSTDGTADVARACGATVVGSDWPGFVAQRNRALALGAAPFQLFLDADERLSADALVAIQRVIAAPGRAVAWSLPRCTVWRGRPLRHGRAYPDRAIRLIRRGAGVWVGDAVHERFAANGPVAHLDGDIVHHPYRDLAEHLRAIDRYSRLHADALRARGVRAGPLAPLGHAAWHLTRAIALDGAWRDGAHGLAFAALGAVHAGLKWRRIRCASP